MPELPHYKNLPDKNCYTCLYKVQKTMSNKGNYKAINYCLLNPSKKLEVCNQYKLGKGIILYAYLDISLSEILAEERNSDRTALYNLAPEILKRAFNYVGT